MAATTTAVLAVLQQMSAQKQLLAALGLVTTFSLVTNYLSCYYLSIAFDEGGTTTSGLPRRGPLVDGGLPLAAVSARDRPGHVSSSSTSLSFLDDENAAFGACLMLMDDDHFLVEWLAYHWFVMPLRHLVVLVDEKSSTSPLEILDRWKGLIDVEVVDWTYPDAYSPAPPQAKGTLHEMPENRKLIGRQLKFYEDCMRHYKLKLGWNSWIVLSDPDEFWAVTPMSSRRRDVDDGGGDGDGSDKLYRDGAPSISEAGSVMKMLKLEYAREVVMNRTDVQRVTIGRGPNVQQEDRTVGMCWDRIHPECVGVPRLQICADDDEEEEDEEEDGDDAEMQSDEDKENSDNDGRNNQPKKSASSLVSGTFQAKEFLTYRWHSFPANGRGLRFPKNMIHVGGLDADYVRKFDALQNGAHPHRFLPGRCVRKCYREIGTFQIYHYSGSLEQRSFRRDPRGKFGNRGGSPPEMCNGATEQFLADDLVPWLPAFINHVGHDEAERLLGGVGSIGPWPSYQN